MEISKFLTNLNNLTATRASFVLPKLQENLTFTLTEFNVPGVNTGSPRFPTPFTDMPIRGDTLVFEEFTATFIVTEGMENWLEVYNWLVGITAPTNPREFRTKKTEYVDGHLNIYSSHNNNILTVNYINMFPTALTGIQFNTTDNESRIITAQVSFMYESYNIVTAWGSDAQP
jgi:hypothetical protein